MILFDNEIVSCKGIWIAKKSRKPFNKTKPPALFVTHFVKTGTSMNVKAANINDWCELSPHEVDIIEYISAEEAAEILKTWNECSKLSSPKLIQGYHIRSKTKNPKKAISHNEVQASLYCLRLRTPDRNCIAYECPDCGEIHLGTNDKNKEIS